MKKQKLFFQDPQIKNLKRSLIVEQREEKQNLKISKHLKILVLGSSAVGKSSLINKYLYESLPDNFPSITDEQYKKIMKIKNEYINLNIIDISGLDEYTPLTTKYSFKVNGYIFIYSVDDEASFEFVKILRDKLFMLNGRNIPCVLVANKVDLKDTRIIGQNQGKETAKLWGAPYLEISSLKYPHDIIKKVFETMIREINIEENETFSTQCWKYLNENRIEGLFELFNFANLLSLIVGLFFIAFGLLNLTLYGMLFGSEKFLYIVIVTGILLIMFSILGFFGLKKENKKLIVWSAILGSIAMISEICCVMFQLLFAQPDSKSLTTNNNLPLKVGTNITNSSSNSSSSTIPVPSTHSPSTGSPISPDNTNNGDDSSSSNTYKPILFCVLAFSLLILLFLLYMVYKAKEILILKRKIRSNRYTGIFLHKANESNVNES